MKYQSNPLLEFFGFPRKDPESIKDPKLVNTITSKKFDETVKLCLIVYLWCCLKYLKYYIGSHNDSHERIWRDMCFYQIDRYLRIAKRQLIGYGLKTFNEDELYDITRRLFLYKYIKCYGGKDWVEADGRNIEQNIMKLQKDNYYIFNLRKIRKHFKLPA